MLFPTPILLKSDQELSFPEHLSAIGEFTGKKNPHTFTDYIVIL